MVRDSPLVGWHLCRDLKEMGQGLHLSGTWWHVWKTKYMPELEEEAVKGVGLCRDERNLADVILLVRGTEYWLLRINIAQSKLVPKKIHFISSS